MKKILWFVLAAFIFSCFAVYAQTTPTTPPAKEEKKAEPKKEEPKKDEKKKDEKKKDEKKKKEEAPKA